MPDRSRKLPRGPNQRAKRVVDIATGEDYENAAAGHKGARDPAAVSLGRRGGLKGGRSRAERLSAEQKRDIARLAARARWGKRDGDDKG